jgi:hypothetical protein
MQITRAWLWSTAFVLSFAMLASASLILLASAFLPLDLRLGNGFLMFDYKGIRNRDIQVVQLRRPGSVVGTIFLQQDMLFFQETLCISLDERVLWERGNNAAMTSRHLRDDSNVRFYVDDVRMSIANGKISAEDALMEYPVFNSRDQLVGTMPEIQYCLNTADLQSGIHAARMSATTLSGVAHRYDWFFEIVELTT